ncbi:hypothetical protein GCM10010425_59630 [Streptomyces spororaveus]|uniref:Uncharacterized protein n=1 Tax=Streptomyces spororaveus TaxID=284039 RepID=A0ABQ3T6Z2_9ACTN|nr:hypothetical protein Sspor_17270 [Streptomyces spororaveus]
MIRDVHDHALLDLVTNDRGTTHLCSEDASERALPRGWRAADDDEGRFHHELHSDTNRDGSGRRLEAGLLLAELDVGALWWDRERGLERIPDIEERHRTAPDRSAASTPPA